MFDNIIVVNVPDGTRYILMGRLQTEEAEYFCQIQKFIL